MCCSRRSTRWFFWADNTFVIQSGDLFFGPTLHSSFKVVTFFLGWHYIRHSKWWPFFGPTLHSSFKVATFFLDWHYIRHSKWWPFFGGWHYIRDSKLCLLFWADIRFDVQRGVCFWPTFDQLFRHLISTSWVLKAVIREHHTVFRHLTSTSRLWKAVFTTHQT